MRRVVQQALEHVDEFRSNELQLMQVVQSKPFQALLAIMGELNKHLTSIVGSPETN
jgi:hypothetical protein